MRIKKEFIVLAIIVFYSLSFGCLFHKITGLYCPGCGITRLLLAILKFDFYQAFRFNPLVFILLIVYLLYEVINLILKLLKRNKIKVNKYVLYFILIIIVAFGIMRNFPAFYYLKPTLIS